MDAYADANLAKMEADQGPRWFVTWSEMKLLFIASTGFFIDAYDLFTINIITVMLNYEYNHKLSGSVANIPLKGGVLKAAANIGCVVGQISFGLLGDVFGRKAVYGKEMMITIIATVMIISVPSYIGAKNVFTWITCFRVLMGIGIGGDYPMSASVVSDRAVLRRRGVMLTFIFAMQGWGNFLGSLIAVILMAIYRKGIRDHGHYSQFNSVWRLLAGLILVPALGTLYQRLTLPESAKMKGVQALRDDPSLLAKGTTSGLQHNYGEHPEGNLEAGNKHDALTKVDTRQYRDDVRAALGAGSVAKTKEGKAQAWRDFREYFSEWRHLRTLIGTTSTWFLVDITFYGLNLNTAIVVASLGLANSKEPWEYIWQQSIASLIIAAAGFLPGYYFTMFTIEYLGRKTIQVGGFVMEALFLGIIAGDFASLQHHKGGFIAAFTFLQFFFNFGANATTFIWPAEVFPTRVRGAAHGLSAACGKCGAIIASLGFATAQAHLGTSNVLWIFFGISFLGAAMTFLIPDTTGVDADLLDLEERQAKAGYGEQFRAALPQNEKGEPVGLPATAAKV